jgi:D-3-phosphoglycerate dehydrogenase / 2-oxoglutarate reductase
MMKVLIIDEMHVSIIPLLEAEGYAVDYRPDIDRQEIMTIIGAYSGLIIRSKTPMDKLLIEKAHQLRFIGRAGAGLDKIDVDYLNERGIKLYHAAEGNKDAVGEQAVGMLLSLFNHIGKADQEVRKGIWLREENRGEELQGKTVGVVGYGNMGQAFAAKLQGFGVRIIVYDKYKSGFGGNGVEEVSLHYLQEQSDILSMHVPLTSETHNMLTLDFLGSFKKPIYLINTARGELISFFTLNAALDRGILRGAVLDVLENEKFNNYSYEQQNEFEKLASRTNVLFSPHIAGWTHQSYVKINEVLIEKIKAG